MEGTRLLIFQVVCMLKSGKHLFADWDSTSGLMLLKEAPLSQDILKLGAGGINQI